MGDVDGRPSSTSAIEEAIRPMRDALRLDGADLELRGESDGVVYLRLEVKDAACAECVLPRQMLESVILSSLQRELGDIAAVSVDDPRETDPAGPATRPVLGILSIGQSPRPDLEEEFRRHAGQAEVVVAGALDDVPREEIERISGLASDYPLQTRLPDGTVVELPKSELEPLLAPCAAKLVRRGAGVVVLACAGDFEPFDCAVPVVVPGRVLPAVVGAISQTRRIGIVTPNPGQRDAARRKWEQDGFVVRVVSASPFAEHELREAAAELSDERLELVVLDCMGHDPAYRLAFARLCGRPVVAAQALVARLAAELVEGLGSTQPPR